MAADPNRVAFDRIIASHPRITGVRPASEVIAGMHSSLILHAAPPTNWSDMSDLMRGGMIEVRNARPSIGGTGRGEDKMCACGLGRVRSGDALSGLTLGASF